MAQGSKLSITATVNPQFFAIVSAFIALSVGFSAAFVARFSKDTISLESVSIQSAQRLSEKAAENQFQLERLRAKIDALDHVPDNGALASDVAELKVEINALRDHQQQLEGMISDSPLKAIALPLMQRDIENLKGSERTTKEEFKEQLDRVYDQNKWFLGGTAIAIIMLALTTILKGKPTAEGKASGE